MSLKANFEEINILLGIFVNLILVYIVLKSLTFIERALGEAGLIAVRKFFGVILAGNCRKDIWQQHQRFWQVTITFAALQAS